MHRPLQIRPGARIGRWVVRSRLGRGAIATVYRAEEIETRTQVALKVLSNDRHDADGRSVERLRREVKLAGRINHSGVCRPLELFEDGELVVLVMEVIPGRSLQEILDRELKLQVGTAVRVVRRVCEALAATHALGILHRDLKPGNIMVRPDGNPTVLDFGYAIAPDVTRVTRSGVWVGTLAYAAPELLKNEPATPQSDIYSLGAILYQCLAGELPFVGKTYGEIASAVLYKDPRPPRVRTPEVNPRLEATVLKALSRDPASRFQTAAALAGALAADDAADVRSGTSSAQMEERTETGIHPPGTAGPSERAPVNVVEDFIRVRQRLAELSAALVRERSDKGLIAGDSDTLDQLEKRAEQELGQVKIGGTLDLLSRALEVARSVSVDQAFVAAKLERLVEALGRAGARRAARCRPHLDQARVAFEAGDFGAANRALNLGFEVLKPR